MLIQRKCIMEYLSRLTMWSMVLQCLLRPHWLLFTIPDDVCVNHAFQDLAQAAGQCNCSVTGWVRWSLFGLGIKFTVAVFIREGNLQRSRCCLESPYEFSVCLQGDVSTVYCGSCRFQGHRSWPPGWTMSNFLISKVCGRFQCCQKWIPFWHCHLALWLIVWNHALWWAEGLSVKATACSLPISLGKWWWHHSSHLAIFQHIFLIYPTHV